jgi:hypothetical protein
LSLLRELSGHPEYVRLLKMAETMKPEMPVWNPNENNVEEWKHKSAMRQGFELCLSIFVPK